MPVCVFLFCISKSEFSLLYGLLVSKILFFLIVYTSIQACSKVLRGAHEWEQHIQGRAHRKRIGKLKKRQSSFLTNVLKLPERDHLDSDV